LTEDEELTVLATIDPLSAMAATDSAKLAELLASVQTDDAALEAVLKGVGGRNGVGDEADWQSEWQGMPEFEQEDVNAFRSIHVHFNTQDDVEEFARRISQPLPEKRNSIWFPAQADNQSMKRTRYHAD
jgi:predicted RNA binding protein with dsRBD fold (UPF0201 family)